MIRSINCTRICTHSPLVKNSLDVFRKNRYWIKNTQQQGSTTSVSDDKGKETLSDISQESSCVGKNSIFFNPQKRNDSETAVENIVSISPTPK
ncbi:MAG: hypothetical protein RJA83_541 [Pseudomonadota bacterium]|jgi:hypothetical protein